MPSPTAAAAHQSDVRPQQAPTTAEDIATGSADAAICVGRCVILPRTRELIIDGVPREIGGRAFDVLMVLIEARGAILDKSEILARVWPDTYVADVNLRVQLAQLRRALGEERDLIKTVPGRGYLFSAQSGLTTVAPTADALVTDLPPTNLRQLRHRLVGRDSALAELREILLAAKIISLVGPGGVGKTQLAIASGWAVLPSFPGGVWQIDLAAIADAAFLPSAIAAAIGVTLSNPDSAIEAIAARIGAQKRLLVLDNCEYLVEAVRSLIEALLSRAPNLSVMTTCQEVLRIAGEQVFRVAPLPVPPPGTLEIGDFPAVALFVERARATDRRFALNEKNIEGVAQICRGLDGIPLALEMAAARFPVLGIVGLSKGLDERLRMLRVSGGAAAGRHLTLRGMLEWSHGLLDVAQRRVFRRLAVFAGSFSIDAVIALVEENGADRWDTLDALERLIEKSLITTEPGDPPRYRLLETVRLFAMEQLEAADECFSARAAHLRFFVTLFEDADANWESTPDEEWLACYELELDNLRAALDWTLADHVHNIESVNLARASGRLWLRKGLLAEGRLYLDRAVERINDGIPPSAAARLLFRAGTLWHDSDRVRAVAWLEQAAAMFRNLDESLPLAAALVALGNFYALSGRCDEAQALLDEADPMLQSSSLHKVRFTALCALATLAVMRDGIDEARRYTLAALMVTRQMNDRDRECHVLMLMAETEFAAKELDRAIELAQEAVSGFRGRFGHVPLGNALINLASYLVLAGRTGEARSIAGEMLLKVRQTGGFLVWLVVMQWAVIAAHEGDLKNAARINGFLDAVANPAQVFSHLTEKALYSRLAELVTTGLAAETRASRIAEGMLWSEQQAVSFVIDRVMTPDT